MSVGVHHVLSDVEPHIEPLVTDFKKGVTEGGNDSGAASDLLSPLSPMTATTMTNELSEEEARDFSALDLEEKDANFRLSSSSIDEDRTMKVVVIGACTSG